MLMRLRQRCRASASMATQRLSPVPDNKPASPAVAKWKGTAYVVRQQLAANSANNISATIDQALKSFQEAGKEGKNKLKKKQQSTSPKTQMIVKKKMKFKS